jgi:hypothetical protein
MCTSSANLAVEARGLASSFPIFLILRDRISSTLLAELLHGFLKEMK